MKVCDEEKRCDAMMLLQRGFPTPFGKLKIEDLSARPIINLQTSSDSLYDPRLPVTRDLLNLCQLVTIRRHTFEPLPRLYCVMSIEEVACEFSAASLSFFCLSLFQTYLR
jgi:hypothetical protein